MKDKNKKIKCAIYGNRNTAKYLIKKRHFFGKTAYYVYKKNWWGNFKLIMDANNDGNLKTLEEAKEWIDKMEFRDYTSEKHYY